MAHFITQQDADFFRYCNVRVFPKIDKIILI
jgi:hypothetical protein